MAPHSAPGLQATWLNGWLAAIGITALVDSARLSWTDDPIPSAIVAIPDDDLAEAVYHSLPDEPSLQRLAIAREHHAAAELKRNVTLEAYHSRVDIERANPNPSLAVTLTDLARPDKNDLVPHSPFDVPVPKGLTLWQRVLSCRQHITDSDDVAASLAGNGRRVKLNGLGFDIRRLASRADSSDKHADPVVELLAFHALPLFPIRGDGRTATTRGWTAPPSRPRAFQWATWRAELDRWGIDAWLDRFYAGVERDVTARFATIPYRPSGSADTTRAYATETLT